MQQLTDEDVDSLLDKAKMFINYVEFGEIDKYENGEIEGNNGNDVEGYDSIEYIKDDITQ